MRWLHQPHEPTRKRERVQQSIGGTSPRSCGTAVGTVRERGYRYSWIQGRSHPPLSGVYAREVLFVGKEVADVWV